MEFKAIIPIAGQATRLLPLSAAVPKALWPLADSRGRVRCVLHRICAEAAAAGIRRVGLIVAPDQREPLRRYFHAARAAGDDDLPERIEYILQRWPRGFGDAVLRGAEFAGRDCPGFLLLLGDHVHAASPGAAPCARQVLSAYRRHGGVAMIGMQPIAGTELSRVGVAGGDPIDDRVYRCRAFIEKPSAALARRRLVSPGLPAGRFLAHCGIYVFSRAIFDCLRRLRRRGARAGGELQLADAQAMLLAENPGQYHLCRIDGRSHDTGTPDAYAAAFAALQKA